MWNLMLHETRPLRYIPYADYRSHPCNGGCGGDIVQKKLKHKKPLANGTEYKGTVKNKEFRAEDWESGDII